MRVFGLDPGSRHTGWGVVERQGNRCRCLGRGCVSPPAGAPLAARLHAIAGAVGALLDEYRPDAVVIEEAFHHESVRSTLVLGHVRGALLVTAAARGLEIAEYSPREIKMSVAGNGGAAKEQVEFMVRRILGLEGALAADASDALAGALCHVHRSRFAPARPASPAARRLEALLARGAR